MEWVNIGANSTIQNGIEIGKRVTVAPGSNVTKSIPPYSKTMGNPLKIIGYNTGKHEMFPKNTLRSKDILDIDLTEMPQVNDLRGSLTFGEFSKIIPFNAKRYFVIYDVPNHHIRGEHAHRKCHQFLICLKGKCKVMLDNGKNTKIFELMEPTKGLHISPLIWATQFEHSKDAVLLVFASDFYDSKDYIRDYEEFKKLCNL